MNLVTLPSFTNFFKAGIFYGIRAIKLYEACMQHVFINGMLAKNHGLFKSVNEQAFLCQKSTIISVIETLATEIVI